ncbi:MAG: Phospho-2-dehydro-3-deoxyheptonate aldolase [Planctomycetes bacterium]|nr:Phospho-2-dehydro-3-deoxyheptonate aldolase [Planctomycetota bacterium]HRJ79647.1 3-deoxy-7-phosphoheptulonate synthase [Planctomycetota bacterium]
MLILMKAKATPLQVEAVARLVIEAGLNVEKSNGSGPVMFSVHAPHSTPTKLTEEEVRKLPGVDRIAHIRTAYKLSSREFQQADTVVSVGGVKIGGKSLAVIAGPCSFESIEQGLEIARALKKAGVSLMRGGIFKPRTSPFSFQGLRDKGISLLDEIRDQTGLCFVTEAVDERSFDLLEDHADMLQIGARNMQNFELLRRAGRSRKPVLLKRGMSATLDELLMAADYILAGGNRQVVLCERGIKSFAHHLRHTLDLGIVPVLKNVSHLPVVVDPSHGTGDARYVGPMALAAAASGADGVMLEVHNDPAHALSDGAQALDLKSFAQLAPRMQAVFKAAHSG